MDPAQATAINDAMNVDEASSITLANVTFPPNRVRTRSQSRSISVPITSSNATNSTISDAPPTYAQGTIVELEGVKWVMVPGSSTLYPLPQLQQPSDRRREHESDDDSSQEDHAPHQFTFSNGNKNHARYPISNYSRSNLARTSITATLGFEGDGFTPAEYQKLLTFFSGLYGMANCGCQDTFQYIEEDNNEQFISTSFATILWFQLLRYLTKSGQSLTRHVQTNGNGVQLWKIIKLECTGSPKQLLRLGNLFNKLVTQPWKEGTESFSCYTSSLIDNIMILESILNVKFPPVMLIVLSLRGLPTRYQQLITSIMNSGSEMTMDCLRLRITEFNQISPYSGTNSNSNSTSAPLLAMQVTTCCWRCGSNTHDRFGCKLSREDVLGKCSICNALGRTNNAHLDAAHGKRPPSSHHSRRSDTKTTKDLPAQSNAVTGNVDEIQNQFME